MCASMCTEVLVLCAWQRLQMMVGTLLSHVQRLCAIIDCGSCQFSGRASKRGNIACIMLLSVQVLVVS